MIVTLLSMTTGRVIDAGTSPADPLYDASHPDESTKYPAAKKVTTDTVYQRGMGYGISEEEDASFANIKKKRNFLQNKTKQKRKNENSVLTSPRLPSGTHIGAKKRRNMCCDMCISADTRG